MPRLTQSERELARKFRKCEKHRKLGKLHYGKADEILAELLKEIPDLSRPHRLSPNGLRVARFKDNFDGTNTAFRAHGIKRFELEIVDLAPRG